MISRAGRSFPSAAGLVAILLAGCQPTRAKAESLKVGNGRDWMFVNSRWNDTKSEGIAGARTSDGDGLQGYCLAFHKPKVYRDLEATFTVQLTANHADIGFIVRAQDPIRYYLIHFPQSGQSYRAQHFWAALSVADGSGYLRMLRLAHVRRVASNPLGIAHQAHVKVTGDRFQVWVNGHPALDERDSTYRQGRIGLAGFAGFAHGKVTVQGSPVAGDPWASAKQVKNWLIPFPDAGGRQGKVSLSKAPNGNLLCAFTADGQRKLGRSTDGGKTWTVAAAPRNLVGDLHLLKDGRLVSITLIHGRGSWSESKDNGKTWTDPTPIEPSGPWPTDPSRIATSWQFALHDGTLIRFGLGRHSSSTEPVTRWGAVHVQAFAVRSQDGGESWSVPVNLDAARRADLGNLDLTEPVGFETKDGRIMCLIRPIYSPWMWETWSSDQGRTWTPCVRGPFPGYAPSTPVRTASGVVLFPTRFPGLTLHHTRDDGMTWDDGGGGAYIDTSIWAMGSLCEVEPDLVLFVYMDSWFDKLRAQFIRVTDKGLMPMRP